MRRKEPDISQEWRAAFVEFWSDPFQTWVRRLGTLSIRPGESIKGIEDEISKEDGVMTRLVLFP